MANKQQKTKQKLTPKQREERIKAAEERAKREAEAKARKDRTKQIFIRAAIRQEPPETVARTLGVSRNVVDQQKRRMLAKFKALVSALKEVL